MYSDSLFNFSKITEEQPLEEAAELLYKIATPKPSFLLDTGIHEDDIFKRAQKISQSIELIEDIKINTNLKKSIYFAAGAMPDLKSVDNRFAAVEKLENTIKDFKESDNPFADHLVAIGPCGIDHDWDSVEYEGRDHDFFDNSTIDDERNLFALELTLGKKLNMPVIVHSRKGYKDTADVLKAIKWNNGVIHGFTYNQSELAFFLDMGWYISFSGTVTYAGKKSFYDMSDVVAYVPKDRLLIESDSPYYAPVPIKNVQNTPENIKYIYEYVASKRKISLLKLCEQVDNNFERLFLSQK